MSTPIAIPEILCNILGHLTSSQKRHSTYQVSRVWCAVSRDQVWAHVDEPRQLFNVLVPLSAATRVRDLLIADVICHHTLQTFTRVPQQEDWLAFKPIAARVRSLKFTLSDVSLTSDIADHLFRAISVPKPVLPNLRHLAWTLPTQGFAVAAQAVHLLFAHPGLESFKIDELSSSFVMDRVYPFRVFALDLAMLAPNLRVLRISVVSFPNVPGMEPGIVSLLSVMHGLEAVYLPISLFTHSVVQLSAGLLRLQTLIPNPVELEYPHQPVDFYSFPPYHPIVDVALYCAPAIPVDAFLSLTTLQLCVPLLDAAKMLSAGHPFVSRLRDLRVRAIGPSNNPTIRAFLQTLAINALSLDALILALDPSVLPSNSTDDSAVWRGDPLDFRTLEPLLALPQIVTCHIRHVVAVEISECELLAFVRYFPLLQDFSLVPSPDWAANDAVIPPPSQFSLATVHKLVDALPRLQYLGLYISFAQGVPSRADLELDCSRALDVLDFGTSAIPDFDTCRLHSSHDLNHDDLGEGMHGFIAFLRNTMCDRPKVAYFGGEYQRNWGLDHPLYAVDLYEMLHAVISRWSLVDRVLRWDYQWWL